MSNRLYRAKRSKFLIIAGTGAIPYGLHLASAPSDLLEESLVWLPHWFDATEIGITWIIAGVLAMFAGISNYARSTQTAQRSYLEMWGFTGIVVVALATLSIQILSWIFYSYPSLGATAWSLFTILSTLNAITWDNPKTAERAHELDVSETISTAVLPVIKEENSE